MQDFYRTWWLILILQLSGSKGETWMLTKGTPALLRHSKDMADKTTIDIYVESCDDCVTSLILTIRGSKQGSVPHFPLTISGVNTSSIECTHDLDKQEKMKMWTCPINFILPTSYRIQKEGNYSNSIVFAFIVYVVNYFPEGSHFLPFALEEASSSDYSKDGLDSYLIGGLFDYHLIFISPGDSKVFMNLYNADHDSSCTGKAYSGSPVVDPSESNILYEFSDLQKVENINWRQSVLTLWLKSEKSLCLTTFKSVEDHRVYDVENIKTAKSWPVLSENYPLSAKHPFTDVKMYPAAGNMVPWFTFEFSELVGGDLSIFFRANDAPLTKNSAFQINLNNILDPFITCNISIAARQFTYTWTPYTSGGRSALKARFSMSLSSGSLTDIIKHDPCKVIQPKPKKNHFLSIFLGIMIPLLLITCILAIVVCRLFCTRLNKGLDQEAMANEEKRPNGVQPWKKRRNNMLQNQINNLGSPYDSSDPWELNPSDLKLGGRIGGGAQADVIFGEYLGQLPLMTLYPELQEEFEMVNGVYPIAIKIPLSAQYAAAILSEISFMKRIEYHQNILCILGCCTNPETPIILIEHCELGDLHSFLRKHKKASREQFIFKLYFPFMARQIADALEYLMSKKIVHRDVAARNVLLTKNKIAKLGDFGLSREMDDFTAELGDLPLRWVAPEVVEFKIYSEKSDVWSYGVLLWEMYTFGEQPYTRLHQDDIFDNVKHGLRLPIPDEVPENMKQLMRNCWRSSASNRPKFCEITVSLPENSRRNDRSGTVLSN